MKHSVSIALWITLSGCLLTKSQPISDFGDNYMREYVECPLDSTFYAPANVKTQCITAALDCVMREFNGTVKHECEDPYEYIDLALEFLDLHVTKRSGKGKGLSNSSECACEKWPQTPFSEFLDKALSLVERANTDWLHG